jgi:hypothetical protein
MSAADDIRRLLAAWRKEHSWQPAMVWDPRQAAYVQPPAAVVTSADRIAEALKQRWYCDLCDRMHLIGEHAEPGAAWPPAPAQAPRAAADRMAVVPFRPASIHIEIVQGLDDAEVARVLRSAAQWIEQTGIS